MLVLWILVIIVVVLVVFLLMARFRNDRVQTSELMALGRRVASKAGYDIPDYHVAVIKKGKTKTIFHRNSSPEVEIRMTDDNGMYYPRETLYLVFLHELAHILSPTPEHTSEFWALERELVGTAISLGYVTEKALIDESYPD